MVGTLVEYEHDVGLLLMMLLLMIKGVRLEESSTMLIKHGVSHNTTFSRPLGVEWAHQRDHKI